jgi:hypothetical protein
VTGPFLILLKYNPVIYNIFEKVSNIWYIQIKNIPDVF